MEAGRLELSFRAHREQPTSTAAASVIPGKRLDGMETLIHARPLPPTTIERNRKWEVDDRQLNRAQSSHYLRPQLPWMTLSTIQTSRIM
jgi:hypothetical protein